MTAKEYLSQAYRLDNRIDSKFEQLSALKDTAAKAVAVMSDTSVSHTRNVRSQQDTLCKIVDMERELDRDIDALVDLKRDITQLIKAVGNPQYQLILEMRYLTYKSWQEIVEILELDDRYVYKLHGLAIKEFEKVFQQGSKRH